MISFVEQFCETDPVAAEAPAAPQALPATIDLQALALSRFGDWRPKAAALVAKYKGVIFDVTTTKGLADATAARLEVRAPRYAAQNVSKASKSELARVSKAIGAEEQAIIDAMAATEEHIDGQIKAGEARMAAEKAERERIEAERVAKHRAGIETIRGYVAQAQGKTAAQIERAIAFVNTVSIGAEWQEFQGEAASMILSVTDALRGLHAATVEREAEAARIEAQRVEQARVAAEQAETQRKLDEQAAALKKQADALAQKLAEGLAEQQRVEAELAAQNTPQGDQPRLERGREGMEPKACDSAEGRGTDGAPAIATLPHNASPVGGPMGTGQPAAAGPAVDAPTINLGQIVSRLGFIVSAEFLKTLGFEAKVEKNSRQYQASDFGRICAALAEHCLAVGEKWQ